MTYFLVFSIDFYIMEEIQGCAVSGSCSHHNVFTKVCVKPSVQNYMETENVKGDMELVGCLAGLPDLRLSIKRSAFTPKQDQLKTLG